MRRFNFGSAIWASIVGTVAMTVTMWFFGVNLMYMLGMTAGKTGTSAYIFGGIIHFAVGIFYGLVYALIFEPIFRRMNGFFAGALYSLLPFFIALFFMGTFTQMIKTTFGNKPAKCAVVMNKNGNEMEMQQKNGNYNRDGSYRNSDHPMPAAKPKSEMKYPCHPCQAGKSGWLASFIGHLIYGIFLGWAYRPRIVQN